MRKIELNKNIKDSSMFKAAVEVINILKDNGFVSVIAGGAVRDMLLGHESHDIDIASSASADMVELLFPKTVPVGKQFGIIVVLHKGFEFEVATFREDSDDSDGRRPDSVTFSSMREDAMRRDLTMNALFFDPTTNEIHDFVHGEKDLMAGIVKFVGSPEKRIEEDKLRMLRAIRFTSKFGFKLDEKSWKAIKKNSIFIDKSVSAERVHEEMNKILMAPKPSVGIEMLRASGLLEPILPEVNALWKCEQSPKWHSEGDVGIHTMMALDAVREESDDIVLLWATLLHDIGKPAVFSIEDGVIRAHGHDKAGEEIARVVLNRLRFSSKDTDDIVWLVGNHMRIKHAKEMKKSTLRRLVADERLNSLVIVSKADTESAICAEPCLTKLDWVEKVESFVGSLKNQVELPKPLISGKDLIGLGFKPGAIFKEILNHISELQLGDEITTIEEALTIAKNW